jgi:hypothetical protein
MNISLAKENNIMMIPKTLQYPTKYPTPSNH